MTLTELIILSIALIFGIIAFTIILVDLYLNCLKPWLKGFIFIEVEDEKRNRNS